MSLQLKKLFHQAISFGTVLGLSMFSVVLAGPPKATEKGADKAAKADEKATEEHAHPDTGPHKGSLIELGEEEYHGEIVIDEKNDLVTIYLLDSSAKKSVLTDAKEVAINLKHAGKGVQYKLKPQPQKDEPKGQSSRYSLKSHDLIHALEHKDSKPILRLAIKGKSYTGKIEVDAHDHDHKHDESKK